MKFSIIITIIILGIVVFVHELGHFLLAKKNGITVTSFQLEWDQELQVLKKTELDIL